VGVAAFPFYSSALIMSKPSYKDLIQLLSAAERDQGNVRSTAELLTARFRDLYPHINISRPARFLETVRRIDGPIRSGRLKGFSRELYLERHWTPRVRNKAAKGNFTRSYCTIISCRLT
jgi:hypothetical protein